MKTYDHILLGTGQATGILLDRLIPTGDSIAVIEESKVGGSCVNYGCTPTKTLIASARAVHMARRGSFFGFDTGEVQLDYDRVRERMNNIRNDSRDGLISWMEGSENVELIRGKGIFTGERILQVGERQLEGKQIYINVGTRPRVPEIVGIDKAPWMDSAGLLDKKNLPEHLIIVGGGYIGVEFSQIFKRFGSKVTIIQRADQLMPREDKDVADAIQDFLSEEGVQIICNANARSVSSNNSGIQVNIEINGSEQVISGSDLLIAAGRSPNSDTLKLEAAGIKTREGGYIQVDDFCRTNIEGVFALGDVNGEGACTS